MFEKIHSYHLKKSLMNKMEETGDFLLPISIHEKQWLKSILREDSASLFLKEETQNKLAHILAEVEEGTEMNILEKGKMEPRIETTDVPLVHHAVRQAISKRHKLFLSYIQNDGEGQEAIEGFPFKLEFNVQKQQWYVLWAKKDHSDGYFISTPLPNIYEWKVLECSDKEYEEYQSIILHLLEADKEKVSILIKDPKQRQRIFYCLSSFDKEIIYEENTERYEIILYYRKGELFDLLQRLRLLGSKVMVTEPPELRQLIRDTAERAVRRYQK